MSTIDDAAEIIGRYVHPDFAEDAARDLAAEGYLAPAPQIIRNAEELEALDPDTLLTYIGYFGSYITAVCLHPDELPAVVVTTTAQVRAAREALEEA